MHRVMRMAAVLAVAGTSVAGVGYVISSVGDQGDPAVQELAVGPVQPDVPLTDSADPGGSTSATVPGDAAPGSTPGLNPPAYGSDSTPSGLPRTSAASSTTGRAPSTTSRPRSPATTPSTTSPVTTATSAPPTTEPLAGNTVPPTPAPAVGTLRVKADGVSVGANVCSNETRSEAAVSVDAATDVKLETISGDSSREVAMQKSVDGDWTADLSSAVTDPAHPLLVTVVATGPGGVTRSSAALPVVDCTP